MGQLLLFSKAMGELFDVRGLKRAGRPKRLRAAEGHRFGAGAFGEACLPVHEHLYLSSSALLDQLLRQFGQEVFADHAGKFFREGMLDFLVAGSFNRGCVRIVGMNAESTARLGFNVEGELGPPYFRTGGFPREDLIREIPSPRRHRCWPESFPAAPGA